MLDLGWTELMVIGVVALIVIGPRDLPSALHQFGKFVGRLRAMARDFQTGIDDIARQHELQELQQNIRKVGSPKRAIEDYVDKLERGDDGKDRPAAVITSAGETEPPEHRGAPPNGAGLQPAAQGDRSDQTANPSENAAPDATSSASKPPTTP